MVVEPAALDPSTIVLHVPLSGSGGGDGGSDGAAVVDGDARVVDMGDALILPRMQALGELDDDETLVSEIAEGTISAPVALPPAIDTIRRKLLLTQLVLRFDRERRGAASLPAIEPGPAATRPILGTLGNFSKNRNFPM